MKNTRASTGLPSLDLIIDDLRFGDNVVWQVDNIGSYRYFASFFIKEALHLHKRLIYVRFGQHQAIIPDDSEIVNNENFHKYQLDAGLGFETFSAAIQNIVANEGEGTYYVFDCLSDLLAEWSTDLMIGNFFRVTCPYLFQLNTIAYFAILRERHSYHAIARIRETTQILIDVFHKEYFCIHPLKVWNRYSPTMFFPHISANGINFAPLASSASVTKLYSDFQYNNITKAERRLDYWDRIFIEAAELTEKAENGDSISRQREMRCFEQLLRMLIGRDIKMQNLARRYFTIADLLQIKARLIGSGYIGGKAVGLLLSRAILTKDSSYNWSQILESHDSFYIGSDIYYTYLVENNCWQLRLEQRKLENYFSLAPSINERILSGNFPELIREQFLEMLEYFGQAPIIVRSSSLLEDGFGNAFAGKYQSVFCANQGDLTERYEQFIKAVQLVYASTMNKDALAYRLERGLAQNDEQMALLVQRVSGIHRGSYYFPDLAGVALSHNLYVWRQDMDPNAGMLRLVSGLGTRAVNRIGDDYARFVALDHPMIRPEANLEEQKIYSQHDMDLIDLEHNSLETVSFQSMVNKELISQLTLFAERDDSNEAASKEDQWFLNFETLLAETDFPVIMRKMLHVLQTAYGYPVDTEFTCNFSSKADFLIDSSRSNLDRFSGVKDENSASPRISPRRAQPNFHINPNESLSNGLSGVKDENSASPRISPRRAQPNFHINLLQCRPLQMNISRKRVIIPEDIPGERVIFITHGRSLGGNLELRIRRLVYIVPELYAALELSQKYEIARVIGRLNQLIESREEVPVILLGPGRWGTSTPSLGIPVSYAEINKFAVFGEIAFKAGGFIPELSYGTHFFQDIIENGNFYLILNEVEPTTVFQHHFFDRRTNQLSRLLPGSKNWQQVIRVIDEDESNLSEEIWIHADIASQKAICWCRK